MKREKFPGRPIRGSGGGGGKAGGGGSARVAQEAADNLQSKQIARVLDLLCEGEIVGIVGGAKGVLLQETPLQNDDDSFNFTDVQFDFRPGTQSQTYIPGFEAQENEVSVNAEIKKAAPVVRQINNLDSTHARVTVSVPALTLQNKTNGDITGTQVEIKIEVQADGGSYQVIDLGGRQVIDGKQRSRYQRSYRFALPGNGPWNLRVTRVTPDATDSATNNRLAWDSFTEIVDVKFTYPNMALAGLKIDAAQFSSIPSRAYHVKLLIVRVPTNYDPETRSYTGVWDGTFKLAWTNNPAWCFYDLVTNTRYGLGKNIPPSMIDKWSLYQIAQYCDQMVDDGKGGTEPRFTMNVFFQTREEAYKVLNDMVSVFRGMMYWAEGAIFAVQDAPSDPVAIFTKQNVIDGVFTREGSSRKARHTAAVVSWNNPEDLYRQVPEFVQDDELIAQLGYRETRVVAFGCTSQGQAHRVGAAILYTEKFESQVILWKAGMEAAYVRPGQIVQIIDGDRQTTRTSGRIVSATSNSITTDAPVHLAAGLAQTLSVAMPDGTIETRVLTNAAGDPTVLTFATALPSTDLAQLVWAVVPENIEPELVRVLVVSEEGPTQYRIAGVQHVPQKYEAIEQGYTLEPPETSTLFRQAAAIQAPQTLVFNEVYVTDPTGTRRHLDVSWQPPTNNTFLSRYFFEYRSGSGGWIGRDELTPETRIIDASSQTYEVRIHSISISGKSSATALQGFYTVDAIAPSPLGRPTGLELLDQANDTIYTGRDPKFVWRVNTGQGAQDLGNETNGGNSGFMDPIFKDYEVSVYLPDGTRVADPDHVLDNRYVYTSERNLEDGTGRSFTLGVAQRDRYNRLSPEARISVTNPNCAIPALLTLASVGKQVQLTVATPVETDWELLHVWIGEAVDFTPSDANKIYSGRTLVVVKDMATADHDYYVRYAVSDTYGIDGMNISGATLVHTTSLGAGDIGAGILTPSHLGVELTGSLGSIADIQEQVDAIDASIASVEAINEAVLDATAAAADAVVARDAAAGSATTAATQAGNAASSASTAATSASNSATSATNASTAASAATTAKVAAESARDAASGSATAASTSASNAATSATNSANSASASAGSATSAATQASNAAGSATSASSSATTATNQASAASTSATGASNSASAASTSAVNASSSAAAAAGSATSAANSATASATSADAASTSATSASTSASSASTHANNASTSASNAGVYSGSAATSATNAADSADEAAASASAAAVQYDEVVARLEPGGDYAAVKTESAASAATIAGNGSTTGLSAQYTVKVDVNGYVAGFGLASTANNGTPYSEFIVAVDKFAVAAPGTTTIEPFQVVSGVTYMKSAMIQNASIAAAQIINLNANQVVASSLAAITATLGAISSGNITLDSTSWIKGGQTAYNSGVGFFIGYSGAAYKLSLGNPAGDYLTWDGSALSMSGTLNAASINLSSGGSIRSGQTAFNTGTGFWLGISSGTPKLSLGNPSGGYLTWDGTEFAARGNMRDTRPYAVGDIPIAMSTQALTAYPSGSSVYSGTSYVFMKEIRVNRAGTIRVKWEMFNENNASGAYGKVYKNGTAVGTEMLKNTGAGSWTSYSDDITVAAGDNVQLYTKTTGSSTYYVGWRKFGLYCSFSDGVVVTESDAQGAVKPDGGAIPPPPPPSGGGGSNDSLHPHSRITLPDGSWKWLADIRPGDQVLGVLADGTLAAVPVLGIKQCILGQRDFIEINGRAVITPGHLMKTPTGYCVPDAACYNVCSYGRWKNVMGMDGIVSAFSEICRPEDCEPVVEGVTQILNDKGEFELVTSAKRYDMSFNTNVLSILVEGSKVIFVNGLSVGALA